MKKTQGGFTLIELIVVIVLLGILGVTALARFQDLSDDAARAALEGIAAEITGTANVAYAKGLVGDTTVCIGSGAAAGANNCDAAAVAVIDTSDDGGEGCPDGTGTSPSILTMLQSAPTAVNGVTITVAASGSDDCSGGAGSTYTCTLGAGAGITATTNLICTE